MKISSPILAVLLLILSLACSEPIRIKLYRKKAISSYVELLPETKQFMHANISLTNYLNDQYIGQVFIGENHQPFNLLFDTGSAWLWVGAKTSGLGNYFECADSRSCQKKDETFRLAYGQGEGYGHLTYDHIHLGENITVANQPFLLVPAIKNMGTLMGDGILGLGFKSLSENYSTFLDTLQDQGIIENRVFSIYLGDDPTSTGDETGDFLLGGYDPGYMQSNFTYCNVVDDNYWAISLHTAQIGNENITIPKGAKAIIDSGTSLMSFPSSTVRDMSNHLLSLGISCHVEAGQPIFCDCPSSIDQFPNITLTFDHGWNATLTGKDYVSYVAGECMLGFQLVDYLNYVILGDIFMRKYYTVFDADNMKIGFAVSTPFIPNHFWRTFFLVCALLLCVSFIAVVVKHYISVLHAKKRAGWMLGTGNEVLLSINKPSLE